ncbi:two-component system, chemotaxis family, response regulator CheY [Allopseudospirillum japonicum]|uniref:Two-component system, chemotaxis family, response regulator CheY n=1 Tax=Allopseudospirillum japonicum TaxID=64971 RepID=A0A1H6S7N1_9GAMM|nr:response regulator [Allopseudospirillum japonicum]SEI63899.1 two-component system, chemotaxis family, response regulator CheY [Allopseudospirillum japonicum]
MKKIFIVDDSATILLSLTNILKQAGFHVESAKNGQEALQKLSTGGKPDLIITDINMPIMNGIELIKSAKALPGFRFVPILVLTTESQQARRQEAKSAGAAGWLVKPVSGSDLLKVIKEVVPGA